MAIAPRSDGRRAPRGPADDGLRRARLCYDHLAGQVAVRLLADLRDRGWLHGRGDVLTLTRDGGEWFRRALGLDPDALCRRRRPLCRPCLDWSERRLHLAGALGAALLDRLLALRYVRLETGSRAVVLLPRGIAFFDSLHPAGPDGALRGREVRPPRPARRRGFSVE